MLRRYRKCLRRYQGGSGGHQGGGTQRELNPNADTRDPSNVISARESQLEVTESSVKSRRAGHRQCDEALSVDSD